MINYKENQNNENAQCQLHKNIKNVINQENSLDLDQSFNDILYQISIEFSSGDIDSLNDAINTINKLDKEVISSQSFIVFDIPKKVVNCLKNRNLISKSLFLCVYYIFTTYIDLKIADAFTKSGIIEVIQESYMNDNEEIHYSLQIFSLISSYSVAARNKILKNIDLQLFSVFDDQQIIYDTYQLIFNLCLFGMSTNNCNYIITILINGINLNQLFVFNTIFQTFYQISYAQEKNWYPLLSDKHIDDILLQYFQIPQFRPQILMIMKRIVETSFVLSDSLISLLFYFLQSDENDFEIEIEENSIEIISDIFKICVEKWSHIEGLLKFNIINALFFISEKGTFQSKINSVFCISKLYKLIVQNLNTKNDINNFLRKVIDIYVKTLSLPQQDIILYILMSIMNILNDSIIQKKVNLIFTTQNKTDLIDELIELQSNEDYLIVEKSQYLLDVIYSLD